LKRCPSAHTDATSVQTPADALIIVPVRDAVLFPGVIAPITIMRQKSIAAAQQAVREQRPIGILLQLSPDMDDPHPIDLHRICTVANVIRYMTASPDDSHHIICQGVRRARIVDFIPGMPFGRPRAGDRGAESDVVRRRGALPEPATPVGPSNCCLRRRRSCLRLSSR
jgi:ATP-dependent Lon protease